MPCLPTLCLCLICLPFSAQPSPSSLPQLRPLAPKALNQLHPGVCRTWQAGLSHCWET